MFRKSLPELRGSSKKIKIKKYQQCAATAGGTYEIILQMP